MRIGPPFPHNLSTKVSRIHASNPREEREEEERERGAPGRGSVLRLFFLAGAGERGEGRGVFKVPTQVSKIPLTQTRH